MLAQHFQVASSGSHPESLHWHRQGSRNNSTTFDTFIIFFGSI
jgi:hypothetical protein